MLKNRLQLQTTFIEKLEEKFGKDRFDYSLLQYEDYKTPIKLICNVCGNIIEEIPSRILRYVEPCSMCRENSSRWTTERLIKISEDKFGTGYYDFSKIEYTGLRNKVLIVCPEHGEQWTNAEVLIRNAKEGRTPCKVCNLHLQFKDEKVNEEKRLLRQENFIKNFTEKWGSENFDFSQLYYIDQNTPVTIICKEHGPITKRPINFIKAGCVDCSRELERKRLEQRFIEKSISIFGNHYDYSKVHYINADMEVTIICNLCGDAFNIIPRNFYRMKQCPLCQDGERLTIDKCYEILNEKFKQFNNKYTFEVIDPALNKYVDNDTIIRTYCPEHGITDRSWGRIKDKNLIYPCIKCSPTGYNWTIERFLEEAKIKWEGKFDYSLINKEIWKGMEKEVPIICPIHGIFYQKPRIHIMYTDWGCPDCARDSTSLTTEEFIRRAKEVHGDKYDYSKTVYINSRTKVEIYCKECQEYFWMLPFNHLGGQCHGSINVIKELKLIGVNF